MVCGLLYQVSRFRLQGYRFHIQCATSLLHSVLYRDMIIFRNSNTSAWARREMHTGFCGGNLREDLGLDEMIILKGIFKELNGGIDRMDVTKDRARFRDVSDYNNQRTV